MFKPDNPNKITYIKTELDFSPEINKQIYKYVETFENEVLKQISKIIEMLLKGNIDEFNSFFKKIQAFLENYIKKCFIQMSYKLMKQFQNKNCLLYYLKIKTLILEKIIDLFENINKMVVAFLEEKETSFTELTKSVLSNLRKIKFIVERKNAFENEDELYLEWKKVNKYGDDDSTLEKIKEYLKDYIKEDLNMEMEYTYDSKFCLWAIKNDYGKYFD